jgi:hypothetical protein
VEIAVKHQKVSHCYRSNGVLGESLASGKDAISWNVIGRQLYGTMTRRAGAVFVKILADTL